MAPARPRCWERLAAAITRAEGHAQRLDALLDIVADTTAATHVYLYLVDASQRRLHLAHARVRMAGAPTRTTTDAGGGAMEGALTAAVGPVAGAHPAESLADVGLAGAENEGGVEASAPIAPLELVRSPDTEHQRTVTTPVGPMHSLPLIESGGAMVGLLQVGPLGRRGLRGTARQRLGELSTPLAFLVATARREEALRQQLAAAQARLEGGQRLAGAAVDLDRFIGLLLDLARNTTGAPAGFVAIVERAGETPVVRMQTGMPPGFAEQVDLSPQDGLFDWSPAIDGGALILRDFEAAGRLGLGALIAVPLFDDDQPLGIFALDFGPHGAFDESALELLATFADQVRLMLHNARLFTTFSDRYLDTVKGLAAALDARRPHTQSHHQRVATLAAALVRELGGGAAEAQALHEAGLIHDVGLAGAVDIEGGAEADVEHPELGASLIEHLPLAPAIAAGVATHHEWFDGWGFPRGLHGEQIPRAGRILALAEFVVEMASGDATREPWPLERLTDEIRARRGSQFDPDVADAALRLADAGALDAAALVV